MAAHCLFLPVLLLYSTVEAQVLVDTVYGPVQGHTVDLSDGSHVNSFLGIPFAKPPVGALRWQPPEEPDPWPLFVADALRSACIQNRQLVLALTHPDWDDFSEDCLHLNIFTPPDLNPSTLNPVMVFLHGGAFIGGANIQYPAQFLASQEVVLVVPNYRLDIFGFASTADGIAPGNYGLLDQLQALRFVQENIAAFGGDPQRVTIFGQSAGGASVGLLMMSPLSTELFHQAALHSGSEMHFFSYRPEENDPHRGFEEVASRRNCSSEDSHQMLDCLREVDAWTLFRTLCGICAWSPVVDGHFLPATPEEIRESGNFAKVPVLSGVTREDGFFFVLGVNDTDPGLSRRQFETRVALHALALVSNDTESEVLEDVEQALDFYYSPWPHLDNAAANLHQIGMLETDMMFGAAQDLQAKAQAEHADTYMFLFGYRSENRWQDTPEWRGVQHSAEIVYLFGHPHLQDNPAVRNDSQFPPDPIEFTEEDKRYADLMMNLWTNFAKYGNPTPVPVESPQGGEITWEPFTNQKLQYIYIANEAVDMRENYRQRDYAFWQYYLEDIMSKETSNE